MGGGGGNVMKFGLSGPACERYYFIIVNRLVQHQI